jgi:hypothetical protein
LLSNKLLKQGNKHKLLLNILTLISYVLTATNNWLLISESYSDSNQCTTYRGKHNTHNMYASHASPRMPLVCFLWAVPIRGNLSLAINSVGQTLLLPRKRALDTIASTPADQSTGTPTSFSPNTTIKVVMKAKNLLTTCYISLLGP